MGQLLENRGFLFCFPLPLFKKIGGGEKVLKRKIKEKQMEKNESYFCFINGFKASSTEKEHFTGRKSAGIPGIGMS